MSRETRHSRHGGRSRAAGPGAPDRLRGGLHRQGSRRGHDRLAVRGAPAGGDHRALREDSRPRDRCVEGPSRDLQARHRHRHHRLEGGGGARHRGEGRCGRQRRRRGRALLGLHPRVRQERRLPGRAHARGLLGQGHAQEPRAEGQDARRGRASARSAAAWPSWAWPSACRSWPSIPFAKDGSCGSRRFSSSRTLLARSHVVSLNCPLTDENRHMINRESLAHDARRRDPREHRAGRPHR